TSAGNGTGRRWTGPGRKRGTAPAKGPEKTDPSLHIHPIVLTNTTKDSKNIKAQQAFPCPGVSRLRLDEPLRLTQPVQQPVRNVVGTARETLHVPQVAPGVGGRIELGRVLLVELQADLPR